MNDLTKTLAAFVGCFAYIGLYMVSYAYAQFWAPPSAIVTVPADEIQIEYLPPATVTIVNEEVEIETFFF